MLLRSADGSELELGIAGYEFPRGGLGEDDDNWLRIRVQVGSPRGSWEATAPTMQTWEIARLADWLEDASRRRVAPFARLEFLEPSLAFEVRRVADGWVALRAYFELQLRPAWAWRGYVGEPDLWVDLAVATEELGVASESLRVELERFPVRGRR